MATKKKAARPAVRAAAPAPKSTSSDMKDCCASSFCGIACSCPVFGVVATRTFWISSALAFIVSMAFDMWWHGSYMMPDYIATAAMWRPLAEMQAMYPWCFGYHAALAMSLSALVLLMGRTGWWGGFITGVLAMAPVAVCNLSAYMHLPFTSLHIPAMWAIGALIQGGLVGIAVTAIARTKSCCGPLCK